jgi:hypothetical protein
MCICTEGKAQELCRRDYDKKWRKKEDGGIEKKT